MMIKRTRLARSLLDRVFGGVCGGLSAYLGIPSWWMRLFLMVVTVLTAGVTALLYLILWWTLPADLESALPYKGQDVAIGRDIARLLLVSAAALLTGGIAVARGMGVLTGPDGSDLFWPLVAVFLGLALFLRALRRS